MLDLLARPLAPLDDCAFPVDGELHRERVDDCLPQSLMRRWLEQLQASDPSAEHLDIEVPGTPDQLITTILDTTEHLDARERAIAAHASQASPFEVLPADLRREFLTADHLRRLDVG